MTDIPQFEEDVASPDVSALFEAAPTPTISPDVAALFEDESTETFQFATESPTPTVFEDANFGADKIIGTPPTTVDDVVAGMPDKGGIFTDALSGFIEGGVRQTASEANILTARVPEQMKRDIPDTFAANVGMGLGQAAVQTGTIILGAKLGAAAGSLGGPLAPVTVPLGATIGGLGAAAYTFFQGFRQELNEVEDQVRAESTSEGEELEAEVEEARLKHVPGALAGEALDTVLTYTTAGTSGLIKGGVKGAVKSVSEAGAKEATRQITRIGAISLAVKSGALEGIGEGIQSVSGEAAVESTLEDTSFFSEVLEAAPTAKTAKAIAVGAVVGTTAKGLAAQNARTKQAAQLKEGIAIVEESLKAEAEGTKASDHAQNVLKVNQTLADIESPNTETTEAVIPQSIATSQALSKIVDEDGSFELLPTEDGEMSIIRGKADRLRELQAAANQARGIKSDEELALEKKIRKSERRVGERLKEIKDVTTPDVVEKISNLEFAEELLQEAETLQIEIMERETAADWPGPKDEKTTDLIQRHNEALELAEEALDLYDSVLTTKEKKATGARKQALKRSELEQVFEETSEEAEKIEPFIVPAIARKEIQQLENAQEKTERLADRLLNRVEFLEQQTYDTDVSKELLKAGVAQEQIELAQAKLTAIREASGIEGLTKGEVRELVQEVEGLEQFFQNANDDTLRDVGLAKGKDGRIVISQETPVVSFPVHVPESTAPSFPGFKRGTFLADVTEADNRPVESLSSEENKRNTNPKRAIVAIWDTFKENVRQKNIVRAAAIQAKATQNAIIQTAEINQALLNNAVDKEVGISTFNSPAEALRKKGEMMDQINKVLTKQAPMDSLPPQLHSTVQEVRGHVDALSLSLIESGIVDGDIVQTIALGLGTYMNRSYKVFSDPNWAKKVDPQIKSRAEGLLRRQIVEREGRIPTDEEIENEIQELLYLKEDSLVSFLVNRKQDNAFRNVLKQRGEIPEEIRALWGERTGAQENYAQTVLNMAALIGTNKYLQTVKERGIGDFLFLNAREGFDVPISSSPTFGSEGLVGPDGERLFTSEAIAKELNRTQSTKEFPLYMRTMFAFIAASKWSKLVPTVAPQIRNFVGNIPLLTANGNFTELFNTTSLKSAANTAYAHILPSQFYDPNKPNSEVTKEFLEKMVRLGVVGEDITTNDIRKSRDDFFNARGTLQEYLNEDTARNIEAFKKTSKKGVSAVIEVMSSVYKGTDAFFKVLAFHAERRKYESAYPELNEAELDQVAATAVRKTMPTYSEAPEVIQNLRRLPFIAPFAMFSSEVLRTQYNTVRLGLKEMSNPKTTDIGKQRLAGLAVAHAGLAGIAWAFKYFSGASDEEEKALRNVAADWHKNKSLALLRSSDDGRKRYFVNLSFSNPLGIIQDPINTFGRADTLAKGAVEAAKELLGPFVAEDIFLRKVVDVTRNSIEGTGKKVYSELDSEPVQWGKIIGHLSESITPGSIDAFKRSLKSDTGIGEDILAEFTGQKIVEQDMGDTAFKKGQTFVDQKAEVSTNLNTVLRKEIVSDADIRNAIALARTQRTEIYSTLRQHYLDLILLSKGNKELITEKLTDAGVGKEDMLFIEQAATPKFEISLKTQAVLEKIPGRLEQIARALGPEFDTLLERKKAKRFTFK